MIVPPLVIRADASTSMGTGHLMRMLALAQAYSACGGHTTLVVAEAPEAVLSRWRTEGFDIQWIDASPGTSEDAIQTAAEASNAQAEWIVVDGYQFDARFQASLKGAGFRVLFVDDYCHADHYYADVVLNQNAYADEGWYARRAPYTIVLAGARYVLLRREFWPWRETDRLFNDAARRILVTMGGADALGATHTLLRVLARAGSPDLEIEVVVGGASPHRESLTRAAQGLSRRVVLHHDPQDIAGLMHRSRLAVASAGTTAWELAFMGVPSLLVVLANNQEPVAGLLAREGAAWNLGRLETFHEDHLASKLGTLLSDRIQWHDMSKRGKQLIDGYGVSRVCSVLTGSGLWLRQARDTDKELLWLWANDPLTRRNAFNSEPIPWDAHEEWFRDRIQTGASLCYFGFSVDDKVVGQARFDSTPDGAIVTVSVDATLRGRGYGSKLIQEAVRRAIAERSYQRVVAYVKPGNTASQRAFAKAGFRLAGRRAVNGCTALQFVTEKEQWLSSARQGM